MVATGDAPVRSAEYGPQNGGQALAIAVRITLLGRRRFRYSSPSSGRGLWL